MADSFTPADALPFTQGVDRSPTEVAALALAADPGIDPAKFLVEALELSAADAKEAVGLLPKPPKSAAKD